MRPNLRPFEAFAVLGPLCAVMVAGFVVPLGFIFFQGFTKDGVFTLGGFSDLFSSVLFIRVFWITMQISVIASVVAVILGYPVALFIHRQPPKRRPFFVMLVLLPFWTSILVKSFAFTVILGDNGVINSILFLLGVPRVEMIFNRFGVLVGTTNFLIPFAVFPILSSLSAQNPALAAAAEVMGARPLRVFWSVTFPLSKEGLVAAFIITFVLSLGFFATPALLGGRQEMMMANLIDFYTRDVLNWHAASAIAVILLVSSGALLLVLLKLRGARQAI